jgi:nucleoside-diphosphate-sugar epimerase
VKVLVTGATGFLGGAVVDRLLKRNYQVRALARGPAGATKRLPKDVELAAGDLAIPSSAIDALRGCDGLIHLAALVKRKAPKPLFDAVNVASTEALLTAAWRANVRTVYTSSFFALGPSDGIPEGRTPQMPHSQESPHTDYERTKREADVRLESLRAAGAPFVTLYPGVLYGPGAFTEANLVIAILRDHLRGKVPGLPGGGRARWCYAYVDDVADAHILALEQGKPGARLALPGDNKTGMQFFEEVQHWTGLAPPKLAIPIPAVWAAGALEELLSSIRGREPKLTRAEALTYSHDWALDGSLGASELGARSTPLREGLQRTLDWLRSVEPELFSKLPARPA